MTTNEIAEIVENITNGYLSTFVDGQGILRYNLNVLGRNYSESIVTVQEYSNEIIEYCTHENIDSDRVLNMISSAGCPVDDGEKELMLDAIAEFLEEHDSITETEFAHAWLDPEVACSRITYIPLHVYNAYKNNNENPVPADVTISVVMSDQNSIVKLSVDDNPDKFWSFDSEFLGNAHVHEFIEEAFRNLVIRPNQMKIDLTSRNAIRFNVLLDQGWYGLETTLLWSDHFQWDYLTPRYLMKRGVKVSY